MSREELLLPSPFMLKVGIAAYGHTSPACFLMPEITWITGKSNI